MIHTALLKKGDGPGKGDSNRSCTQQYSDNWNAINWGTKKVVEPEPTEDLKAPSFKDIYKID